ncbi:Uncharacterised protein [Mycobacteroides abscessus subsp. abscessus]|nr:Uncharacterised protein [Mycobacteroides abscessus subsp. abscessus]
MHGNEPLSFKLQKGFYCILGIDMGNRHKPFGFIRSNRHQDNIKLVLFRYLLESPEIARIPCKIN